MNQELINTFKLLVEGKITPSTWLDWFEVHQIAIEEWCGRRIFLKIKPYSNCTDLTNIHSAQLTAYDWLKSQNITVQPDDSYKIACEKEFKEFIRQEKLKAKALQDQIRTDFEDLKTEYPKFYRQLLRSFDTENHLQKGVTLSDLQSKEEYLAVTLPPELSTFFMNLSQIKLEGITIDFDDITLTTIDDQSFLELGEYWYYSDGDILLYDLATEKALTYAHEYQPPKLIPLADGMKALVEQHFVKHLKSYDN
ncbi:hypothetical protein [Flavobacterium sp. '19STA2R22 D10 B1']|uniref:hypothetical protein n=1 Tax=Flavobacterium aerium TaxID=3037261 RepID=UPI00278C12EF|nr:hypothetical protein [Flavobacterium sp. '19STA2R22 D10 B1']